MKTFEEFLAEKNVNVLNRIHSVTSASKAGNAAQAIRDKMHGTSDPVAKAREQIALQAHKNLVQHLKPEAVV